MDTLTQQRPGVLSRTDAPHESAVSAVSWPAIFAGAFVAAAFSLVLVALGSGFGLASVSPWPDTGASATTFTVMTAIWLIVVQWLASGLGGYVAGRMRTKWANTHTHEVFFRDTAHGLITWAVGTILVAGFLASAVGSAISGGVHAAAAVGAGAAAGGGAAGAATAAAQGAGVSAEEAQKRVDVAIAQAKAADLEARQVADKVRKTAAETSIFTALSMLVGAFIACVAAALGGQRRDLHA